MNKNWFSGLLLTVLLMSVAAVVSAEPCNADLEQFCGYENAGDGNLAACLEKNMDRISYQCRERLKKIDQVTRRKLNACSQDARNYCRGVTPGYGRIKNCLMSNLDKLSNECRAELQ